MKKQTLFTKARPHITLSTGETVRMLRELKGWTQNTLAKKSGISPTNLSLIENNNVDIGKKRALQLAQAFNIHPAIIMFPEFEGQEIKQAA